MAATTRGRRPTGATATTTATRAGSTTAPIATACRLDYLKVGDNFNPEVGFTRRDNFRRSFGSARFSPRPNGSKRVRKYTIGRDVRISRQRIGPARDRVSAESGSTPSSRTATRLSVEVNNNYELLLRPFTVSPGVVIPAGGYTFSDVTMSYGFGQQRRASGTVAVQTRPVLQRRHQRGQATAAGASRC